MRETWALVMQPHQGGYHKWSEYGVQVIFNIIFFAILYFVIYFVCDLLLEEFSKMTKTKKSDYVGRIISIVHAVLVTILSGISCFCIW